MCCHVGITARKIKEKETMSLWLLLGFVFIFGGVGGLVSSLLNDNGLLLPKKIPRGDGNVIFSPGFIGNMLTGAVAASVSWLLYGPLSQIQIGTAPGTQTMMVATLGGAVLIGMVGSAWLINAVGKNLFQAAAYHAASAPSSPDASKQMLTATPIDALNIAKRINTGIVPPQASGGSVPGEGSIAPS
jgi:hypothetical protein